MKTNFLKLTTIVFLSLIFFKLSLSNAQAARIQVDPSTGSFKVGESFTVDLKVDGTGNSFNVAQTSISLTNLSVNNLILGDCNFAFIKTPQSTSPSFTGGILGGSSSGCTVYTLTLVPKAAGNASITLTNSSIIEYKTTKELFSSPINGNYTISGNSTNTSTTPTLTLTPTTAYNSKFKPTPTLIGNNNSDNPNNQNNQNNNQNSMLNNNYDVLVNVFDANNSPVPGAQVTLNSGQTETTNVQGTATFTNITEGVYQIDVTSQNKKIPSTVLNVSGTNHTVVLGIKEQKTPINIWIWVILALAVIVLVPTTVILYKKWKGARG